MDSRASVPFSVPRRAALFAEDPVASLRGLATLTDPEDGVAAVVDLAVIGARGDGKTQFIVHAARALHAHAPALSGAEQRLNEDVMRLVLDPRAPRPEATPPGVVPHVTFRVRMGGILERVGAARAFRLACSAGRIVGMVTVAAAMIVCGIAAGIAGAAAGSVLLIGAGAIVGASAAIVARRRIDRLADIEVVFWDIAGEQVYSAEAAAYHTLLGRLVDARRRRAEAMGRSYAFVPILVCNPLALGTGVEGSPYERLRELLPVFAALDRNAPRALIAINRWSVVDSICERGALRDEAVSVIVRARGDELAPPVVVAREQVRAHCLDVEDGRKQGVRITYLRYDTAIRSSVEVDRAGGTISYEFDDGPSAFTGDAGRQFLDWVVSLAAWQPARAVEPQAVVASEPVAAPVSHVIEPPPESRYAPPQIWARPRDLEHR
ncbi:MAG TPA: hypothetical protein VM513_33330 [Kofleriaceae bacterium]|nr:hypothetical protein [Kofleriaceae bacterium]